MSREVRRVPKGWEHPTATVSRRNGTTYQPVWVGLRSDEMDGLIGDREATMWQMYETTSEGTPISPPCESPRALARWLVEHGATTFASKTASESDWLAMIEGSGATVGFVMNTATGEQRTGWLDGQST